MVKAVAWNREDTAEILIRSDVTPGGNIHNKASTSCVCVLVGIGGGGGQGPLSIVRHNTGISVCRHLSR